MAFIRPLIFGIATAIAIWLMYVAVCLGALPSGPDFRAGYILGIGGAIYSAYRCAKDGVARSLVYATIFYIPVAAMFLHLIQACTPYKNGGKEQWQWIWLATTAATYAAAIVCVYVVPQVAVENDDA